MKTMRCLVLSTNADRRMYFVDPEKLRILLDINKQQFANLLGVHRNTLSAGRSSHIVRVRTDRLVGFLDWLAVQFVKSNEDVLHWFKNTPIEMFDGDTPMEAYPGREDALRRYVSSLLNGALG